MFFLPFIYIHILPILFLSSSSFLFPYVLDEQNKKGIERKEEDREDEEWGSKIEGDKEVKQENKRARSRKKEEQRVAESDKGERKFPSSNMSGSVLKWLYWRGKRKIGYEGKSLVMELKTIPGF